jgi:hypothetical protein
VSTQVPPRAATLFGLWQRLPDTPLTESELDQAISRPWIEGQATRQTPLHFSFY